MMVHENVSSVWYLSYLFCKQLSNVLMKGHPILTVLKIGDKRPVVRD
jgi:hypothetical protein